MACLQKTIKIHNLTPMDCCQGATKFIDGMEMYIQVSNLYTQYIFITN
jgi:hypothetical protein